MCSAVVYGYSLRPFPGISLFLLTFQNAAEGVGWLHWGREMGLF